MSPRLGVPGHPAWCKCRACAPSMPSVPPRPAIVPVATEPAPEPAPVEPHPRFKLPLDFAETEAPRESTSEEDLRRQLRKAESTIRQLRDELRSERALRGRVAKSLRSALARLT